MAKISHRDLVLLAEWMDSGILKKVKPEEMHLHKGAIMIACADGDQMYDKFTHQIKLCVKGGQNRRVHLLALNGGALLLKKDTSLNKVLHEDLVLLKHLGEANELKGISTCLLYGHAPCGAAHKAKLSLIEVMASLISALERVQKQFAFLHSFALFHVDYKKDPELKKTYLVDQQAWYDWQKKKAEL